MLINQGLYKHKNHNVSYTRKISLYFETAQGPESLNSRKHRNVTGNVSLYLKKEKLWNTSGCCQQIALI